MMKIVVADDPAICREGLIQMIVEENTGRTRRKTSEYQKSHLNGGTR
jgi:hypothetical protein